MNLKELRLKRLRHGITAKQMSELLGISYQWTLLLEKGYYSGPCVPEWRDKYEAALNELIKEKRATKR